MGTDRADDEAVADRWTVVRYEVYLGERRIDVLVRFRDWDEWFCFDDGRWIWSGAESLDRIDLLARLTPGLDEAVAAMRREE